MNFKIEKSFQNSQFYRNYNNIDHVILKFEKIKNEYKSSKIKYKNEFISIINTLHKNQLHYKFLEKLIMNLSNKYNQFNFKKELNILFNNKIINIDEHILNSCRKILNEKINITHNIKKYVKYSENINDDFIRSIKIGNIKNINFLIQNGADLHCKNEYALKISSKYGNIKVVEFLFEKGENINLNNNYENNFYNEEYAYSSIEYEDDIYIEDDALSLSCQNGHIEVVKFLVENGANICADNCELVLSIFNGHIEVVKFLVENGANIHAGDSIALKYSIIYNQIEIVKFLVEKGADIHTDDEYALRKSSENEYIEIVKFLINSDLEYFINKEFARNIVINHNLIEFYEKFNIK